jgi:hypothetical protein
MPSLAAVAASLLQARQESGVDQPDASQQESPYGYMPDKAICILFLSLFAFSTLLHTGQATAYRMWWLFPTVILGGIGEILGWTGRLWSSENILHETPFMIQIATTIIAPTFILAANFIMFGRIINTLGDAYSRLPPRLYSRIFLSCDIISLIVQAAGGGTAAAANTLEAANVGGNIMLGGITFQLFLITVYLALAGEFLVRYHWNKPFPKRENATERGQLSTRSLTMLLGLGFNSLFLFIRAIYRTIELADGWDGRIINTQVYFNVLDGGMVVLAIYAFNFIHPGVFLESKFKRKLATRSDDSIRV